ncbi:polyhydroxyalkanoic acid system family protein [Limnobacter parvus]|uniref:Polyhydroxyalkanoic acid system family protein n=1 Tax=Limnobacter parvus TaxID=2939690 RepID=A0ABT1XGL4_9BURK|nr:polyhydroxyalkanoic acid system family protein [Limnobacter parvus]MCR2746034.1 polyhydroxyalkanoic acid system family protein [Limnobacter parvus]
MSDIHARKEHNMSLEEAKQTAQKLADQLQKEFQLDSQWQGNTLNFTRSGVKGKLDVTDKDVTVDISLGFMLKAFKGKIQTEIDKNIDKMFA